ncbi:MAG TPA: CHAT domain-containing protein [Desulfomonilaceae bacterium]|nr:CHAT domain-containing protein [Desulfomonilaceae bacterium]
MTSWTANIKSLERRRKTCWLFIACMAIIVLLAGPSISGGRSNSAGSRGDSNEKEDSSRVRKVEGKTQISSGDADAVRPKGHESGKPLDKRRSGEDFERRVPSAKTEVFKSKGKETDQGAAEAGGARENARSRVKNLAQPVFDSEKSEKRRALKDPRGTLRLQRAELEAAKTKGNLQRGQDLIFGRKERLAGTQTKVQLQAQKDAHAKLGQTHYFIGEYKKAAQQYSKALELVRLHGTPREKGRVLHHLTAVWTTLAEYRTAEQYGRESLQAFEQAGDAEGVATVYNDLGLLEENRGRFKKALENYQKALDANKEQNQLRVVTFNRLASLCVRWGEYKKAVQYYEDALASAGSTKDPSAEGDTLINIGTVYAELGLHDDALNYALKGLHALSRAGLPTDRAKKIVGDLYLDSGRLDQAEPYIKEAGYESSLGRLYLLRAQYDEARKHYEKFKAASESQGDLDGSFTALTGLGKIAEAQKDYRGAENYYSKAVNVNEQIRSTLLLAERKNFFAATVNGFPRSEPAKGLVRVTLKEKEPERSLYAGELARAREFADSLAEKTDGHNFNVPNDVLEKEEELTNKLASLMNGRDLIPKSADKERFEELGLEIKSLETDRNNFVRMLWTNYPAYASAKYPVPAALERSSLGPDEYVIVFDLLGEGLGVELLKGKRILESSFTPMDVRQLESDVHRFREPFEKVKLDQFDATLGKKLYERLLATPFKQVPQGAPVKIIPDGFLALLPFEALVAQGEAHWQIGQWGSYPEGLTYAVDVHPISYYQSVNAITIVRTLMKKPEQSNRMLVVADPVFTIADSRAQQGDQGIRLAENRNDAGFHLMTAVEEEAGGSFNLNRLPGTGKLADDLRKLYGKDAEVYRGLQSTKQTLMSQIAPTISAYKYVVFATHGFAGNGIPGIMEPVLALTMVPPGTDGLLTASEVAGLKMAADVAALTACQTGTGFRLAGEGVMSMGRAFQLAGARSVIMSLWSVSETSSIMLMESFFSKLKQGKSKLDALSAARAELRRSGFRHPFFWSAFVLVGETK